MSLALTLTLLARARQAEFAEEDQIIYAHVLRDLDLGLIGAACEELAREPREAFASTMPTVGDIRARCERIEYARAQEPLATFACPKCQDEPNGWIQWECPQTHCGRARPHAPHPFTARCPCWLRRNGAMIRLRDQKNREKGRPQTQDAIALGELESGAYPYIPQVGQSPT